MKERGIIFRGGMVRAILDGRKTQTRRLPSVNNSMVDGRPWSAKDFAQLDFDSPKVFVDRGPSPAGNAGPYLHVSNHDGELSHRVYPIWQLGDRLWVRETFLNNALAGYEPVWFYKADDADKPDDRRWRSPIHMPRIASRITLEITKVRVERLQDISEEDAKAEGVESQRVGYWADGRAGGKKVGGHDSYIESYGELWDSLHGKGAWEKNPWVWVLEFRRVEP